MTAPLTKGFASGTHRLVAPEVTLERIAPHLLRFGITRCADITGLDRIGIPVYVAVRPQGRVL
jgi:ribosomal protein S12 methylthiotransferase accessory factor YcaO